MNVGWIGLGKLGLTCALTLEQHAGVEIIGYDTNPAVRDILASRVEPSSNEQGLPELIGATMMTLAEDYTQVVAETDGLIFVSVQTPHRAEYGGEKPMPDTRQDFDYQYLVEAVRNISTAADELGKDITLVVISTVLPGTCRRVLLPELSDRVKLVYNPFFIAMGTTMHDYLNPEFVLMGAEKIEDCIPLGDLYRRFLGQEIRVLSIESAELTKVAYNTFISMKIVFANTLMEICDHVGADVDEVTGSLALATDRVVSPAYMSGGMGDGGACHPRDNIAMSWLARSLGLSVDPFEFVTQAREKQTWWLARLVAHHAQNIERPIVILGKAYKPGSDLVYGSPALLLAHYLEADGIEFEHYDHYVDRGPEPTAYPWSSPAIYVIATKHPEYATFPFKPGSLVIDPFRYIPPQDGVEILNLGAGWRD